LSVTLDSTSARSRDAKKLQLNPDVGDSGSKKCKRRYGVAYDKIWEVCVRQECEARWSVWFWCVGSNLASVAVKNFITVHFINIFYNCCTLNVFEMIMVQKLYYSSTHKRSIVVKSNGSDACGFKRHVIHTKFDEDVSRGPIFGSIYRHTYVVF
jgi:hypothetical protein